MTRASWLAAFTAFACAPLSGQAQESVPVPSREQSLAGCMLDIEQAGRLASAADFAKADALCECIYQSFPRTPSMTRDDFVRAIGSCNRDFETDPSKFTQKYAAGSTFEARYGATPLSESSNWRMCAKISRFHVEDSGKAPTDRAWMTCLMDNSENANQQRLTALCQSSTRKSSVCSSPLGPTFSGRTAMDDDLKYSVLEIAEIRAKMGSDCNSPVDTVRMELVSSSPDVAWNEKGQMIHGESLERWTLSFCNTQKPVDVRVRRSPDGHSSFTVGSPPGRQ